MFNKAFDRKGTLFEGPFKAILVKDDSHLLHIFRYIHRNPLEAGLVTDLMKWSFSNYPEWVGKRSGALYDAKFSQEHFSDLAAYEMFVLDYHPSSDMDQIVQKLSFEK